MYLFNNVIISPYFPTKAHYANPSLFGGISVDSLYGHHWQYGKITSHKCDIPDTEICQFDRPCIYCGYLFSGWGHFILESLAMLWFVNKLPNDLPLVFSYSTRSEIQPYQKQVFESFGIDWHRVVVINKVTCFKEIYMPPAGYALGTWYLHEQQVALELCESRPQKGKKVYISRRKYNAKRGAVNEDDLESILKSRGWSIMYPEKLSFMEQLFELSSAETVFCVSGSALHSIIFLKNIKSKFIIIPRGHGVTYNMIVDAKGIENYYLFDVPKEILTPDIKTQVGQSILLDVSFIDCVLRETDDFTRIDLSKGYFRKPNKVGFDYRKTMVSIKGSVNNEFGKSYDNILYKIMYYYSVKNDDLTKRYIHELIAQGYFPEYGIKKVLDIAHKMDDGLALEFLECVLQKININSDEYAAYSKMFKSIFQKVHKIVDVGIAQMYRKMGLYELEKKNYIVALGFLKISLKNGGNITNRGTIIEVYNKIGLHDEAIKYAKETIQINNKLAWAYAHLAISYFCKEDYQTAYTSINRAFEMNPNSRWIVGIKRRIEECMK